MQSRRRSSSVQQGFAGVSYPGDDKPIIFLEDAGVQAVLAACRSYAPRNTPYGTERNLAIFHIAVFAGLRVNEIRMLDVGDIDFNARGVHVRFGKGSHKRGPKYRFVVLNQDAINTVEHYLDLRDNPGPDEPLFVTNRGRISRRTIQWLVRKIGDEVQIQVVANGKVYHLSPHKLRHTFVTGLVNRGEPMIVARDLAGHASSATTERYAHGSISHRAVDALSKPRQDEPTMTDLMASQAAMMEELARLREQLGER